jgi:DNA-binding MarR family transcriptional regulator
MRAKGARTKISDLKSHTGFWLRFVSNHVSHKFAGKLAGSGVTVAEWVVLREMFDPGVTSPSSLARATGLTRGAVSKLVDRLRAKKLVTRTEAAEDRRFQDVSLTAAGRALVPKLATLADRNDHEFFSHLPAAERARLVLTLKKLVQANKLSKLPTE